MSWKDVLAHHDPCIALMPGQRVRVKEDFSVLHMADPWRGREVEVVRTKPVWHHPAGGYGVVTDDAGKKRILTLAAFEVIGQRDLFGNS